MSATVHSTPSRPPRKATFLRSLRRGLLSPTRKENVEDSNRGIGRVEDGPLSALFPISTPFPVCGSYKDGHVHGISS